MMDLTIMSNFEKQDALIPYFWPSKHTVEVFAIYFKVKLNKIYLYCTTVDAHK